LQNKIEKYISANKKLETGIGCEKEQHVVSKAKVDEMISIINKSNPIIDDQYQEILLLQLKEKNDEIVQLRSCNNKLTKNIQTSQKDFDLLKSQVSALLK